MDLRLNWEIALPMPRALLQFITEQTPLNSAPMLTLKPAKSALRNPES